MNKLLLSASASLLAVTMLVACGGGSGGGSSSSSSSLDGVAAIGAPIIGGTIEANCADGQTYTSTNPSNANGVWRINNVPASAPPCALKLTGGTAGGNPAPELYSYADSTTGDINITPLTDLIVALAAGDPAAWFDDFGEGDALDVEAATDILFEALDDSGYDLSRITDFNPLTASFNPVAGDPYDDLLESLGAAVNGDYTELRALAADGALELPEAPAAVEPEDPPVEEPPVEEPPTEEPPVDEPGTGDGAALGGKDGATGTFDGVTYTFAKDDAAEIFPNTGWQALNPFAPQEQRRYQFDAMKSEGGNVDALTFWRLTGVPGTIGTHACGTEQNNTLPVVRLGLGGGVLKDSTSCSITITEFDMPFGSAFGTVTGTFTAVIDGKTVSDGYFKATAVPPPSK